MSIHPLTIAQYPDPCHMEMRHSGSGLQYLSSLLCTTLSSLLQQMLQYQQSWLPLIKLGREVCTHSISDSHPKPRSNKEANACSLWSVQQLIFSWLPQHQSTAGRSPDDLSAISIYSGVLYLYYLIWHCMIFCVMYCLDEARPWSGTHGQAWTDSRFLNLSYY